MRRDSLFYALTDRALHVLAQAQSECRRHAEVIDEAENAEEIKAEAIKHSSIMRDIEVKIERVYKEILVFCKREVSNG